MSLQPTAFLYQPALSLLQRTSLRQQSCASPLPLTKFAGKRLDLLRSDATHALRSFRRSSLRMSGGNSSAPSDAMLHIVYRVGSLDDTKRFLSILGLKVLRERDIPDGKFTNVFFGGGSESNAEHVSLELTYNYGQESYNIGDGFGCFGVAVSDVQKTVDRLRQAGFKITTEPVSVDGGKSYKAFVEDPTGYPFELRQEIRREPIYKVSLRVADVNKSKKFYESVGMMELDRHHSDEGRYTAVTLGYKQGDDSTLLEITSAEGRGNYDNGDGYGQIAVRSFDVYKSAEKMKEAGFTPSKEPGPVSGIGTKIVAFRDDDEWKVVMVDSEDFEKELQ